jgi:hypothetical protein
MAANVQPHPGIYERDRPLPEARCLPESHFWRFTSLLQIEPMPSSANTPPPQLAEVRFMLISILLPDNSDLDVDTDLYKTDIQYRRQIHEKLQLPPDLEPLDWDFICASDEELQAMGAKPIYDSNDYPTEEAAQEALRKLLEDFGAEPLPGRSMH